MAEKIILVTGGSRSGKSSYAQKEAENISGKKLFIATCPAIDTEMDRRVAIHKEDRIGKGWETLEEETDLVNAIQTNHTASVMLIDCLTLWINNLLYKKSLISQRIDEQEVSFLCSNILKECNNYPGTVFFVTNEVGSGIVPESEYTRLYRDLVGRCNQVIAGSADQVILVSCGIPLFLKG